jgi:hypothetical protein
MAWNLYGLMAGSAALVTGCGGPTLEDVERKVAQKADADRATCVELEADRTYECEVVDLNARVDENDDEFNTVRVRVSRDGSRVVEASDDAGDSNRYGGSGY